MVQSILFVCLGNICRSPSAEGVVRRQAARRGLALRVDSAGTGDWHSGSMPYGPMRAAAHARGYDLDGQRARQVRQGDFADFDLILAMDAQNLADLHALSDGGAEFRLLTDFAPAALGADHVPDPYYTGDFHGALDLIEACAEGLLDHVESARKIR